MSEGLELEWILEKKDCGLHHRNLARDQPNPNSQVQYADLHGPDEQCRIVLLLSYPAVSAGVRPMMLNLCGQCLWLPQSSHGCTFYIT
jgi:hypothetical protein